MTDLIVFKVANNRYALNIENIQRIIQAIDLTNIPNSSVFVDGMMSHEDGVIKVLSFRKLIGMSSYEGELEVLFAKLKVAHQEWIEELRSAVFNGSSFTKTIDPHKCELGIWLDNFNSYDDTVSRVLEGLIQNHKYLHASGGDALELLKENKESAQKKVDTEIYDTFNRTMSDIDILIKPNDID